MSEVTRYQVPSHDLADHFETFCLSNEKQTVVLASDYDSLAAECERLRGSRDSLMRCDVCLGLGDVPNCICKGTGSSAEEKVGLRLECHRLSEELSALRDSAKLAEKDAERYSFLRNNIGPPSDPHILAGRGWHEPTLIREAADSAIDAAIDAHRAKSLEGGEGK